MRPCPSRKSYGTEDRVNHIARHGVTPEEFEEVCFGAPLALRAKATGQNPVYYVVRECHDRGTRPQPRRVVAVTGVASCRPKTPRWSRRCGRPRWQPTSLA